VRTSPRPPSADQLFPVLAGQGAIAIDTETKDPELKTRGPGYHRPDTFVAGVSVGTEAGFRQYYPMRHEGGDNLDPAKVRSWLKRELARPVPKIGLNLGYDVGFLRKEGIEVKGPLYDVGVAEALLDENRLNYGLDSISKSHLGVGKDDEELERWISEKFGKKNPKSNIWRAPGKVVTPYAIGDVDRPLRIFAKQKPRLEEEKLWDLFQMESKLIPMLVDMRYRGVRVDIPAAEKLYEELTQRQDRLEAEIARKTGVRVAVWEADSLAKMFDEMGATYPLTPKTKKPSFTKDWLAASDQPAAKMVLDIRQLDKLRGTFLRGCVLEAAERGRVHCQFHQMKSNEGGTTTGRLSASDPNLQFVAARTEDGKKVRALFLPDQGQEWYSADYSQIEYRLIAHDAAKLNLRGSAAVVEAYKNDSGADFHQVISDMVFGQEKDPEKASFNRKRAKTINFGIAYGEGVPKLCKSLGLSPEEGQKLMNAYHRRAPFIKPLSDGCMRQAASTGEIRTLLGRKRRFTAWSVWDREKKEFAVVYKRVPGARRAFTHAALNARIQGSAADIMKKAMVDVYESGVIAEIGIPQLTVHDELDGSFPKTKRGREAVKEMKRIMENVVKLLVPLRADLGTGKNWLEAHD
jgi:DNA polymerase I-like protein with 3'-5' exonuclease and polymerase domains